MKTRTIAFALCSLLLCPTFLAAAAPEPVEEYDRFLRTIARARPYFERLAASARRTQKSC